MLWEFDFGDGSPIISYDEKTFPGSTSHTYTTPGTYTVKLTVRANDGEDETTVVITVTEPTSGESETEGQSDGNSGTPLHPVSTATGELFSGTTDLFLGGPLPLSFGRYYASLLTNDGNVASALGNNWMHNFDLRLVLDSTEAKVVYYRGKTIEFETNNGAWELKNPEPIFYQLVESVSDLILMDPSRDLIFTFNSTGRLIEIEDRNGNALTLTYTGDDLTQVSDGLGRMLDFTYSSGQLTEVEDQSGRTISFSYTGDNLTAYTDALGNTTTYSYTEAGSLVGLMTSEIFPEGNTPYTQTWDTEGRVDTQTDSEGNTNTLAFNTPGEGVTTVTDPLSNTIAHTHQNMKNLIQHQDQDGETFSLSYDANNRRNGLTDRLGDTTSSTYHAASGKPASYADAEGNTTSYTYMAQVQGDFIFYNLSRVDYADGTSISMSYNASGNMLTLNDRDGKTWTYTYNSAGQLLTGTNPAAGKMTYTYNSDGTPATGKDHFNNTTSFDYDTMKRLIKITRPDASFRSFTYDDNDNLLTVTDERGKLTTYTYDNNNNLETITDPLGETSTLTYDGNDRLTSLVDRLNQTTAFAYDELERLEAITNPNNETTTYGYSGQGWLTSVTNPFGKSFSRTYDKEGVLSSFSDPMTNTWNYITDKLGRTTRITTPLANTYDYTYDSMGRLTSYTNPLSQETTYTRDNRGLLTGIILPEGISASYTRNSLGLITKVTDPNGNAWNRSYDQIGRLTSRTDPLSNATSYAYDSRNRVSTVTFPESSLQLTYNEVGNITRRLYSDNTDLQYTYDDNSRLLTANGVNLSYDVRGDIIGCNGLTMTRDNVGRIATITLAPGKTVTYSYNSRGFVEQVTDWVGGNTDFVYDDASRLMRITRPNGVKTTYTYDNDSRLIGVKEEKSGTLSSINLTRDAAGQITSANRNVPLLPDPTLGTDSFTYNAASQVSGYTYDKMGRLTGDGTRTYTWDLASRLTSYTEGGNTTGFTYNGFGMRLSRTSGGVTQQYVWNYAFGLPAISVVRQGGSDLRYYIHLPDGELLHSIEASDNRRRFFHFDEMGTTLFLTNNSGTVSDTYGTTPYGQITASTGTTENPFTFIGAYGVMQEGDTGLYYMRARFYDYTNGGFLSQDPVTSISPKSISPYQYALQNPLGYVDPSGLQYRELSKATRYIFRSEMGMRIEDFILDLDIRPPGGWAPGQPFPSVESFWRDHQESCTKPLPASSQRAAINHKPLLLPLWSYSTLQRPEMLWVFGNADSPYTIHGVLFSNTPVWTAKPKQRPAVAYVKSIRGIRLKDRKKAFGAKTMGRVPYNKPVIILEGNLSKDRWVKVKYRRSSGWIQSCALREDKAEPTFKPLERLERKFDDYSITNAAKG